MLPTKRLIDGMRQTADMLEESSPSGSDSYCAYQYEHSSYASCILGMLTLATSEMSKKQIGDIMVLTAKGYYSNPLNNVCEETGIPLNDVFAHLYSMGLDHSDLENIEFAGRRKNEYAPTRREAIEYLRAKASQLEKLREETNFDDSQFVSIFS